MVKEKVLVDTDIGSDIDDALCISYLLTEPKCELLGITTVTGEAEKRAQMAHALCVSAGKKEIPVFSGATTPLYGPQRQPIAPQWEIFQDKLPDREFGSHVALDFMAETIRKNPGEVTLLGVGPLTNIALLFTLYPDIPGILKQLVLMCGIFHYRLPGLENHDYEWNATADPYATSIVYRSNVPIHRSVGMDVTCQVIMEKDEAEKSFSGGVLAPILSATKWFDSHPYIVFHDPLAAVSIFHDVCKFEHGSVKLTVERENHQARTGWIPGGNHNPHEVASEVNPEEFYRHFFGAIHQ